MPKSSTNSLKDLYLRRATISTFIFSFKSGNSENSMTSPTFSFPRFSSKIRISIVFLPDAILLYGLSNSLIECCIDKAHAARHMKFCVQGLQTDRIWPPLSAVLSLFVQAVGVDGGPLRDQGMDLRDEIQRKKDTTTGLSSDPCHELCTFSRILRAYPYEGSMARALSRHRFASSFFPYMKYRFPILPHAFLWQASDASACL